ncbi:RpiR family transcriptional regulator [Alkalibaculum bacchi]|uniref:RpiR family transcriptional regulator n=1 Tax=Alkalibaculum bacchi TaxID=645887 RepID=A0A366I6Y2_9FIRM|nr:MurR/RpiR family transcriptional regulator [Alkalibaculum bacchi]RBP63347.1 RpiR family transcriptional regulator [Alkalibaculum bacchi]
MIKERSYEELIKASYSNLSNSEKKVADYILLNGHEVTKLSLCDLAQEISISEPTIIRFAKHIGLSGYSELKLKIMKDWGKKTVSNTDDSLLIDLHIGPEDKLEDLPEKVINITIKGLHDTLNIFNTDNFKKAISVISSANRIDIFGVGNSASIAQDFISKLIRIGLTARFYADNHLQQLSCLSLTNDDVVIAITHSGSTKDVIDTLKLAKEAGATTIALTNYKASLISKYADIELLTGDYETTFYSETMVSRISQLAIVDMLYMGILLSDYEKYTKRLDRVNVLVESKNY